ncbi:MAG TPA: cellulose synthase operon protein YhjQ/BcsQ [Bryobacteraceae bacterium]|jgi:pilus assembly protein CpaE|nr:cellulose synthase operon protein YhjQ/BcsQ [Bryobacteraceae bacterium]
MRSILISPNQELRSQFEQAVAPLRGIGLSKRLEAYPEADLLSRVVRAWAPDVVFLSMEDPQAAELVSRQLSAEFPGVQGIGIHTSHDSSVFHLALRLRLREVLIAPFQAEDLVNLIDDVNKHLEANPVNIGCANRFFAYLPAKPGAGASTIAANATWAFSETENSHVLLADFDTHSGMSGFMFNVDHEYSLADATGRTVNLDDESWQRLVRKVGNIDLLLSGAPRMNDENINMKQVGQLLEFIRRNYSVVNVDLPDSFDERSLAVLREASRIFLVTTPELPSLRMARMKAGLLRKLELEDKVCLLVNRVSRKADLSGDEIEETVGLPVFASFPCDYADVTKSIREAKQAAKLAPSIRLFVQKLLDKNPPREKRARFIQRFALVPHKYEFKS